MSKAIFAPRIDPREVKRRADFVAIASRYMKLRRAGAQYRGLCLIHDECDPSLYIESERKIWKCFGCGVGGDLFSFIMLAEGCDFPRALQIVADSVSGRKVARGGETRSVERLAASEENVVVSARVAGVTHSQKHSEHARLVARLDATERRNAAIRAANDSAFLEFERACEPSENSLLLETTG